MKKLLADAKTTLRGNFTLITLQLTFDTFRGNGGGATPVPIPNTVVKSSSADGTWVATPWESRSLRNNLVKRTSIYLEVLFLCKTE